MLSRNVLGSMNLMEDAEHLLWKKHYWFDLIFDIWYFFKFNWFLNLEINYLFIWIYFWILFIDNLF